VFPLTYDRDVLNGKKYCIKFNPYFTGMYRYSIKGRTGKWKIVYQSEERSLRIETSDIHRIHHAPIITNHQVLSNEVKLNWSKNTDDDIAGYEVYRSNIESASSYSLIARLDNDITQFVDTYSTQQPTYYKIVSFNKYLFRSESDALLVEPKNEIVNVLLRVHIPEYTPSNERIMIVGPFNGWNLTANELTRVTPTVAEYSFQMPIGKTLEYKYTRGSWSTEAFTSQRRILNDNTDLGNWAYGSTTTNMKLTIENQGNNTMIVNDYIVRWADIPIVIYSPIFTVVEQELHYKTTKEFIDLNFSVPFGVKVTLNDEVLQEDTVSSHGAVQLKDLPLVGGLNYFRVKIEPSNETKKALWFTRVRAYTLTREALIIIEKN
jgi:hypothetical protein